MQEQLGDCEKELAVNRPAAKALLRIFAIAATRSISAVDNGADICDPRAQLELISQTLPTLIAARQRLLLQVMLLGRRWRRSLRLRLRRLVTSPLLPIARDRRHRRLEPLRCRLTRPRHRRLAQRAT